MENTELSTDEIVQEEQVITSEVEKEKIPDELLCNICHEEKFSTVTSGHLRVCDACLGIITKPIRTEKNSIPERNKPCPCGSGKKAKKCCLEKFDISDELVFEYGKE